MATLQFSCPVDITSMPKTSCGYFCTGCKKEVIDFRNSEPGKIEQHLAGAGGKTCGIFNPVQLSGPARSQVSTWFKIAFAAIFILGINVETFGQEHTDSLSTPVTVENPVIIEGVVLDENGHPLPFSRVYVEEAGTRIGALCDVEGKFKIILPATFLGKKIELKARSVAYSEYGATIDSLPAITQDYKITLEEAPMLGVTMEVVGYATPIISMDPYDAGKTTFSAEDIRRIAK